MMTKEYMKEEFWKDFPEATHYTEADEDNYAAFWAFKEGEDRPYKCWVIYNIGEMEIDVHEYPYFTDKNKRALIKKPDFQKKEAETYIPKVGDLVQNKLDVKGYSEIILLRNGGAIIEQDDGVAADYVWFTKSQCKPIPVEPTIQEKLLDKWQRQSLDFAYDDLKASVTLQEVFDFIAANYNLEEK